MHPGDLHGDASTLAIAEKVGLVDADLVQQRNGILRICSIVSGRSISAVCP